jgi:hypothetical protein
LPDVSSEEKEARAHLVDVDLTAPPTTPLLVNQGDRLVDPVLLA